MKETQLKTFVGDVSDDYKGIKVDVVIGTGSGTKGNWTFGHSFLTGSLILLYEDGQVVSAKTPGLFEAMVKFRKSS